MEETFSYHSIPTSCQIFVQTSKIATDFLHLLTLWISPFIFLKRKYDVIKDYNNITSYMPDEARDGQNVALK